MKSYAMRWAFGLYALWMLGNQPEHIRAQTLPVGSAPAADREPTQPAATKAGVVAPPLPGPSQPVPAPTTALSAPKLPPPRNDAAACVLGAHDGIAPADAATSAILVCEALRSAGANVMTKLATDADAMANGSAYRMELHPLGSIVVLQVRFESPVGVLAQSRSLQLNGIEEVPLAAPRLADSLLHGTPLAKTAKLNTLVGQETRSYTKEYGETLVGIGIFGFALPDAAWAGYGVSGRLYYETARYGFGAELRIGGSSRSSADMSLVGISVGGRYFFNDAEIAPFVGGGLGIIWLGLDRPTGAPNSSGFQQSTTLHGSGLALFGEVGVEFLRVHRTRFDVSLRAEAPVFTLSEGGNSEYRVPIALMGSFSL